MFPQVLSNYIFAPKRFHCLHLPTAGHVLAYGDRIGNGQKEEWRLCKITSLTTQSFGIKLSLIFMNPQIHKQKRYKSYKLGVMGGNAFKPDVQSNLGTWKGGSSWVKTNQKLQFLLLKLLISKHNLIDTWWVWSSSGFFSCKLLHKHVDLLVSREHWTRRSCLVPNSKTLPPICASPFLW